MLLHNLITKSIFLIIDYCGPFIITTHIFFNIDYYEPLLLSINNIPCTTVLLLLLFTRAGYSRLRVCTEGAAAAETEARDQEEDTRRHAHRIRLEMLRRRQELHVTRHLGTSHEATVQSSNVRYSCHYSNIKK